MEKGIFEAKRSDNSIYYRVSIIFEGKHISIGSYNNLKEAKSARKEAEKICFDNLLTINDYKEIKSLSFEKFIVLINYRDNKIYFRTPIYLKSNFFYYYLSPTNVYKFDKDDLFYYSNHKIMKRGNHLFVFDYGYQINLFDRYNIPSYSVYGRDYRFRNDDPTDFRYENIEIINPYHGVVKKDTKRKIVYIAKIHINGYIKIGEYKTELEAAIAYNKACDIVSQKTKTQYIQNNPNISPKEYAEIYTKIRISDKLTT